MGDETEEEKEGNHADGGSASYQLTKLSISLHLHLRTYYRGSRSWSGPGH